MRTRAVLLLTLLLLTACSGGPDDGFAEPTPPPEPVDPDTLCNIAGATRCTGFDYEVCVEGRWFRQETCSAPTPQCEPDVGCTGCTPDTSFCVEREVWACDSEGSGVDLVEECGAGEECLLGQCYSACDLAESTESYLGCRFLSIPTANLVDAAFWSDFGIVVANPSETDLAQVTVRTGGSTIATESVPAGESAAIVLPMNQALQNWIETTRVPQAAFEVTSSIPIAAYQYSPLHFQTEVGNVFENSFTNDASLLLPEHVLTGSYRVSTWPTWGIGDFPGTSSWSSGFVAITATQDGTLVEVTTSANTAGGSDVAAMEVGDNTVVSLDRGDVLQILSEVPEGSLVTNTCADRGGEEGEHNYGGGVCLDRVLGDLTGTRIVADQPVAVFAGHLCTFIPFDRYACDHLEEAMFPTETWGTAVVMTAVHQPGGFAESVVPSWYRVVSGGDANQITFSNDVAPTALLNEGDFVEFLGFGDFVIEGTRPLFVTQAMLGEDATQTNSGDPALGSGIPLAQWRDEYDFLVPDTYSSNWLNVVAPDGAEIYLDGLIIDTWEEIDDAAFSVARIELEPGAHRVESVDDEGFGITSYGYAAYTSYFHPGGMNFLRGR
ncbi:MAG: hypothetical protein GY898_07225 [Proteobacteria bacterium]|nr:hypothetical protein [Pseudomonadota bacterium]